MLEVLDEYGIRCSCSLNVSVLERFPEIADALRKRDWAFINHGFYNTRFITTFRTNSSASSSSAAAKSSGATWAAT